MKPIKIIKNRSDIGAGTRGSDLGIDAIEVAAINHRSKYFTRFPYEDLETHNETVYTKVNAQFAKRIVFVREQCERVAEAVSATLLGDHFPIVLSGDHSSALGTMSGIKQAYPDKTLGVIWVDAHADLHSPYTTPSGNVHGMPLAAAMGIDNRSYQRNDVLGETLDTWEQVKNIGVSGPKLKPDHLVMFGVRDTEVPEDAVMLKYGIRNFTVEEYRYRKPRTCLKEAFERLADCDMLYVSFDVDSMDCDRVSMGTGTPVPKGFDPNEVTDIIKACFDTGKVVCFEITEVNPLLDTKGNVMAETAFTVLNDVTAHYLAPNL